MKLDDGVQEQGDELHESGERQELEKGTSWIRGV